jgi:predicted transcriptional regulator
MKLAERILEVLTPEGLSWDQMEKKLDRDRSNIARELRKLEADGKAERVKVQAMHQTRRTVTDKRSGPHMIWRLRQ